MRRSAPLVVGIVAVLAAGGGQAHPKLMTQTNADALNQTADAIQAACDRRDRTEVRKQLGLAESEIAELPRAVDSGMRSNLQDWVEQMRKRVSSDWKAEETP